MLWDPEMSCQSLMSDSQKCLVCWTAQIFQIKERQISRSTTNSR